MATYINIVTKIIAGSRYNPAVHFLLYILTHPLDFYEAPGYSDSAFTRAISARTSFNTSSGVLDVNIS